MVNLEHCDAITLLFTASAALRGNQLKDAALLYHAGKIRAKIDLAHYKSVSKWGNGPSQAMGNLIHIVSQQINSHPAFSMPTA